MMQDVLVPPEINAIASLFGDVNLRDKTKVVGVGYSSMLPHFVVNGHFNHINGDQATMSHIKRELLGIQFPLPTEVVTNNGNQYYTPINANVA